MVKLEKIDILNEHGFHIGETVLSNDSITFLHTHDFYEVFFVKEGEVIHHINGRQALLKKGMIWMVNPEDVHNFRKGKCKKTHFINLAFSEEVLETAKKAYVICTDGRGISENTSAHMPQGMEIAVLSKLTFLARDRANLIPVTKKDTLVSILLDCLIMLENQSDISGGAPDWLERACLEMKKEENYLKGVVRFTYLSGKSQEHLTRCMKKYYHLTPTEYINSIKLEKAAILLETTENSILDIIFESGFSNISYFNQLFKKAYGTTPSGYRRLNRLLINPE